MDIHTSRGGGFVESVVVDGMDNIPAYLNLRSEMGLRALASELRERHTYVDVTGLSYSVLAPLIRAMVNASAPFSVLYRQPLRYVAAESPSPGRLFSMHPSSAGMAPLPGFASLRPDLSSVSAHTVVILGFEGSRIDYLINEIEPDMERLHIVLGSPGFRPEYPTFSLLANRQAIERFSLHARIWFANSACPFSLYETLGRIKRKTRAQRLRVAPFGTKPHAVGSVLYQLKNSDSTELVFDHPVASEVPGTEGRGRLHRFDVSDYLDAL
ncbi:hypothetical protein [Phycicoccus sonneratiae]|uniref:Uncharacterized protein n=1 Tax=Phycicoccus sonneratiae TaxID=2807628 RepID=A0ABS2CQ80_9MICO|nr:hypothetical protein [Phycicoccus sonneraticus]MBM6402044.1 hypothetical protein [Phycicoccus sonneraticus]